MRGWIKKLAIKPFVGSEVQEYFKILSDEWCKISRENPEDMRIDDIAYAFSLIANNPEQSEVLELYTGGQPVRLALYSDLWIEGAQIPEPLNPKSQAYKQLKLSRPTGNNELLQQARFEIEGEFINLLFRAPETIHARILKILARAQRGLTPEQIHLGLEPVTYTSINEWKIRASDSELSKIKETLREMRQLSMIKNGPNGTLSLQDEIFHIYNTHLKVNPEIKEDEIEDRRELYNRLRAWAQYHRELQEANRRANQQEDEFALQSKMVQAKPSDAAAFASRN
jgi:hypothetical protein